ncbi:MAG: DinB family protein, partial [Candidatus Thermoplasmatota archaeon]|nr:DinB family protein [Candidatus Thermoplasmatota archaeon]
MAQRPGGGAPGDERPSKQRLATRLEAVRARTLDLLEPLSDEQLTHQPGPEMGVVLWDVGHIGAFEEVWLVNNLSQGERSLSALGERFDPIAHPRAARGEMALPSRQEMLNYLRDVRKRSLDLLDQVDLASDDPLVRHGFVHDMIIRHEQQHQ